MPMHWQIKTRVWGRIIPNAGWHIQNGHINRIYYIHSGKVYVQINQKTMQLIPGYLYLLPEGIRFTAWMSEDAPMDHTYFDFDVMPYFHLQQILQIKVADYPLIEKWLDLAEEEILLLASAIADSGEYEATWLYAVRYPAYGESSATQGNYIANHDVLMLLEREKTEGESRTALEMRLLQEQ